MHHEIPRPSGSTFRQKLYCFVVGAIFSAIQAMANSAYAQDLVPLQEIESKILNAISIANELLGNTDPPKYKLMKVVVELAGVKTDSGGIRIQIPILAHGAGVGGDYSTITTIRDKYTYRPVADIEIGAPDDFGLLKFVRHLQSGLTKKALDTGFVKTSAEHYEEFVVARTVEGELSFFNFFEAGVTHETRNLHSIDFFFCLQNAAGECVEAD